MVEPVNEALRFLRRRYKMRVVCGCRHPFYPSVFLFILRIKRSGTAVARLDSEGGIHIGPGRIDRLAYGAALDLPAPLPLWKNTPSCCMN